MKNIVYRTICVLLSALLVSSPVFADLSAGNVISTSGATVTDINGNLTEVQTDAADGINAEVKWNNLSIGSGQTLHNVFNGQNQTLIHRVLGGNMSYINGSITSGGVGNATSKMILINQNGVYFNGATGATVNVPSLIVSTIEDVKITANQAKFSNKNNNNAAIQVYNYNSNYNSTFEAPYGISLVSAGTIYMRNSTLHSSDGNVQLVSADGVNFKFKNNNIAQKANNVKATQGNGVSSRYVYLYNSGLKAADKGIVNVHSKANNKGTSYVIAMASKAIEAPDGTVHFVTENADSDGKAYFYTFNNPEIRAKKTDIRAKEILVYDGIKASNDLNIKAPALSSYYSYLKEIYEQNYPQYLSYLESHPRGELAAGGKLNINTQFLKMEDGKLESGRNLTFKADKIIRDGVVFSSDHIVKLTLNDQDLGIESYDSNNDKLALSYDNDANNEFYISNGNKTVSLNASENNKISVNNVIDKNSAFALKAGNIAVSNNGTIANNKTVNITSLKEDIVIDSYNSAADELNVKFGTDTLKIKNKKAAVALATSKDNSLTVKDTINKNSTFTLTAGRLLAQGNALLDTKKDVKITALAQDMAIDSYDALTNTLNLLFGNNNAIALRNHRNTTLNASENNTLAVNSLIGKDRAFTLSSGNFDVADDAGFSTTKKVKVTSKSNDLNLISSDSTGIERFQDENDIFLLVDTDTLANRLDPDQLGTGRLEIYAKNANLNVFNNFDRAVDKLSASGKVNGNKAVVNLYEPAPLPPVVIQAILNIIANQGANNNLADESIQTANNLGPNNDLGNIQRGIFNFNNSPGNFNFSNFGGASAGINNSDDSNKFVGILFNDNIEYYRVLEPLLYNN